MNESKRRYVLYATNEKLNLVNKKNKEHIKKYFSLKENLSESSKKSYMSDFNQWLVYVFENYENQDILKINEEDSVDLIEDFTAFCTSILGNNDRRIQRRFSSISSFYSTFKKINKIKENPINCLNRPKIVKGENIQIKQNFLTKAQLFKIRKGLKEIDETQLELFFEFALSTMARGNAISNILIDQIDFDKCIVNDVEDRQGHKITLFPSERCMHLIKKWINERNNLGIENEYLFIARYGGVYNNVKKQTLQTSWIKKIGRLIDLHELSLSDLRHSGANLLFQEGLPLEILSKLLNNSSTIINKDNSDVIDYEKIKEHKSRIKI